MEPRLNNEKAEIVALCSLPGITTRAARQLLTLYGSPSGAWEAVRRGLSSGTLDRRADRREKFERWRSLALAKDPRANLHSIERRGNKVSVLGDIDYPTRLAETHDPPLVIFYRGRLPPPEAACVAVVGSRRAGSYGLEVSRWFSAELARSGVLVVSGAAYGVDSEAHRGALEEGGGTVSVLGCGPDVFYPRTNRRLLESIAAEGCVLSEYPPGTGPRKHHFPARNRIIAGLSLAVVVVEAPAGSGALITADIAASEGRDVMAVPGSVLSPASAGCNELIRNGAVPVMTPEDVLLELGLDTPSGTTPFAAQEATDPREARLLDALDSGIEEVEVIASRAGMSVAEALSRASVLEVRGLVRRGPGGRFSRTFCPPRSQSQRK